MANDSSLEQILERLEKLRAEIAELTDELKRMHRERQMKRALPSPPGEATGEQPPAP